VKAFRSLVRRPAPQAAEPREVILYRELGRYGQLGNQLWQIAATMGIAESRGADARFPPWDYRELFSVPAAFFSADLPENGIDAWSTAQHIPPSHRYFLQDVNLFSGIADRVRRYFEPSPAVMSDLATRFAEFIDIPDKTAIHVRRGDYFDHPDSLVVQGVDYYRAAIEMLGDTNLVVFSDDMEWCREALGWAQPRLFMEGNPAYIDLFLMARCDRHVIANSSFSWWGAYLANDPQAIFPERWFGPALAHVDATLMFVPGWIGIDA
jgi:hypothetical protein